jgi:UDP:flavonoid glycosyltransferase YjiC (YdhE family)
VIFTMGANGHVQRLRPLVAALAARGMEPWVFTDARFEADIRAEGGQFTDLYDGRPLAAVDDESRPMPARYVSFAGHYAAGVIDQVAALRPAVVMADTFATIGRVVAAALGLPHVNVCAGHNVDPARFVAQMQADPRVHVGPGLESAVALLRDRYGMADASPLSYIDGLSTVLNLYCEPEQYLTPAEREVFEPVAFFGSTPSADAIAARTRTSAPTAFPEDPAPVTLYVSFGTVVWWATPADPRFSTAVDARAGLEAIARALETRRDVRALMSLGGAALDAEVVDGLRRRNVAVAPYVDQWDVLRQADLFVTHQGLNSTHEAIVSRVPMLSYPFIWDQPALAATCQRLGTALPLAPTLRAPLDDELVHAALDAYLDRRDALTAAVARAREWELDTIAGRPAVVQRIIDLA